MIAEATGMEAIANDYNSVLHSYSLPERLGHVMVSLFSGFLALGFSLFAVWVLVQSLAQFSVDADVRWIVAWLALWLFPIFWAYSFVLFTNLYPQIRLSDKGIYVTVFLFWWAFIPWADVEEIRRVGWLRLSRSRLVVVRRLTPFHRFIGWHYGYTLKPAFVIRGTLQGYDRVVKTIQNQIAAYR
jgi:hypothetical protein